MGKHAKSVDTQLLDRIISKRQGSVFTPADFLDLGSRTAVGLALMRHARAGTIRPLARGLYDYATAWIAEIIRKVAAQVLPKSGPK